MILDLVRPLWNYRFDPVSSEPFANARITVSFVPCDLFRALPRPPQLLWNSHGVHYRLEAFRLVALAWGDFCREGNASAVTYQVDLCPKPAS